MNDTQKTRQFGRKQTNTVVISANGKVREYKVHAGIFLAIGAVFTMVMVGYVAATTYLAFRDDLMAAAIKRNVEMQRSYEDRIAALRSKVDRITSRQLLDQQAVEEKVAALMRQQELLTGQTGALKGLFERARKNGISADRASLKTNGEKKARLDPVQTGTVKLADTTILGSAGSFLRGSSIDNAAGEKIAILPDSDINSLTPRSGLFTNMLGQINQIASSQRATIVAIQEEVHRKTTELAGVFTKLRVPLPKKVTENVGGPFIPDGGVDFEDLSDGLNESLDALEQIRQKVRTLPVGNPVPGASISSSFGKRVDPFHRRSAFHSGIDFRAKTGTPVLASGTGKVVKAGRNGGYGLMVEVDHGHGLTTRYAHLSRILVKPGQWVSKGNKIGKVGSTGRSTGPHLHYEVRRANKASNPKSFLNVGKKIKKLL